MNRTVSCLIAAGAALLTAAAPAGAAPVVIGCKKDVEGSLLAEIMAQLLEARGFAVERRFDLGSTLVCFEALRNGSIDLYPEYSGTLGQEILKRPARGSYAELQKEVRREYGMELLASFGFQNTYAVAVSRRAADAGSLKRISDLARQPGLRYGFSHEFLERKDGWPGLARTYGLTARPAAIAHGLAYRAVHDDRLDVTDAYSTDGDIAKYDLVVLEDDRGYFPEYLAGPLLRGGLEPAITRALGELADRISEARMRALNARVAVDQAGFAEVAHDFLAESGLVQGGRASQSVDWERILRDTADHLRLTALAVGAAVLAAVPLGVVVYRFRAISRPVMYLTGTVQTVPSIALLAFMIPFLGIGARPAVAALFLYAMLPILRNTAAALFSIDPVLKKVSVGMGLTAWQRLRYVELPLAAPTILAGVRTAAVITIGTATLAAFIGAGGLGELIVTGLEVHSTRLVLEGAVPAALLAVVTELAFEGIERLAVPGHLLQRSGE